MTTVAVIAALLMVAGLAGILIPVLPGLLLVWAGVLLWSVESESTVGWWVLGLATAWMVLGFVLEYLVPGQRMRRAGVRTSTLVVGVVTAVFAAFVVPVVGALAGFPLGIYLVERVRRGGHRQAWEATKHALRAVGLNILIELLTAMAMIITWVAALVWFV